MATHSPDEERQWAAEKRDFVSDRRDEVAAERDELADLRDVASDERQTGLDERERQLDARATELGLPAGYAEAAVQRADAHSRRVRAARGREDLGARCCRCGAGPGDRATAG